MAGHVLLRPYLVKDGCTAAVPAAGCCMGEAVCQWNGSAVLYDTHLLLISKHDGVSWSGGNEIGCLPARGWLKQAEPKLAVAVSGLSDCSGHYC